MARSGDAKAQKASRKIEQFAKKFILLDRRPIRPSRKIVAASGALPSSKSAASSQHASGTSRATAAASKFLETVLATADPMDVTQESISDQYRLRVEQLPISKIEGTDDVDEFKASNDTWRLIELAAERSVAAYSDSPDSMSGHSVFELKPKGDSKRVLATIEGSVLVVSIRGTMGKMDWMVNGNGEALSAQNLGDPAARYHKGYLTVAEAMQRQLAEEIHSAATKLYTQRELPGDMELLFTGHSAGGAMAQLFYTMAMEYSHRDIATIAPYFQQVHCIVFGAPPITTIPIPRPKSAPFALGKFLSVVNEEDPVPLLQASYLPAMIEVFVLSPKQLAAKYPDGFTVPDPVFHVSGPCVVLRDIKRSDMNKTVLDAVEIRGETLERKLFGNIAAHRKEEYLNRCKMLRSSMSI